MVEWCISVGWLTRARHDLMRAWHHPDCTEQRQDIKTLLGIAKQAAIKMMEMVPVESEFWTSGTINIANNIKSRSAEGKFHTSMTSLDILSVCCPQLSRTMTDKERLALIQTTDDKVKVTETKQCGLTLQANKDFKAGDKIIDEPCLAWSGGRAAVCWYCLTAPKATMIECRDCLVATYCSEACLQKDLGRHSAACSCGFYDKVKKLFSIQTNSPGDLAGLVLLAELFLTKPEWLNQMSHEWPKEAKMPLPQLCMAYSTVTSMTSMHNKLSMDTFLSVKLKIMKYLMSSNEIGLVGNLSRFINHSDKPNAGFTLVRNKGERPSIQVHALTAIKNGEEICFSYIPMTCKKKREALLPLGIYR